MQLLHLPAKEILNILEDKKLSASYKIEKKTTYAFYYDKYIYGLYRYKTSNERFHYFKATNYQPIKIISPTIVQDKKHREKIFNTFISENRSKNKVYLFLKISRGFLLIAYTNKKNPSLIAHYKIPFSLSFEEIINRINEIIASDNQEGFPELKKLGEKLWNTLFNARLQKIIGLANSFVFKNNTSLNFSVLNQDKIFPFIKNPTLFHQPIKSKKIFQTIKSLQLITSLDDNFMKKELSTIENILEKKCRLPYAILQAPTRENFHQEFAEKDFTHLIYHGKEENGGFSLLQKNEIFISQQEILNLKAPKLLFFSTCFSKNFSNINWFFENGGQTLITCQGKIFSKNLVIAWGTFYWWLFYKKVNVKTAFSKMINRLYYLNDINVFKFHIFGYGKEVI